MGSGVPIRSARDEDVGVEIRFSKEIRLAAPTKVTGTCSVGKPVREISEEGVPSSDQNFLYRVTVAGGELGGRGTDGSRTGDGDAEGVVILLGERLGGVLAGRGVWKDAVFRGKARATRSLFRSACRLAA